MSTTKPLPLLRLEYANAAEAYLRGLPPEHFMEATTQSIQRVITSESLDLVKIERPEVQYFNELCVQYPHGRPPRIRQVVPDTMVVLCENAIQAGTSYDIPFQPVGPYWVLEYVSKHSQRKDYDLSFGKYERDLKVPYYLLFFPDNQDLSLFHLRRGKYVSVRANRAGRLAIPKLDLEMDLLDGWLRFWFQGALLPLPAELQGQLREARAEAQHLRAKNERLLAYLRALGIEPPQ
jgi:Uma2 family endonuclease